MINPFREPKDDLINISNGKKCASTDIANAKQIGQEALSEAQEMGSSSVKAVKLQTFVDKMKQHQSLVQKSKKVYEEESNVIRNLHFLQNLSNKEKVETFSHEWTSYPSSLFEPDTNMANGFAMQGGNKAEYKIGIKKQLGDSWTDMDQLPISDQRTHFIIDMMSFVQQNSHHSCKTFQDLQVKYIEVILAKRPSDCQIISLVGDRYDAKPDKSLKYEERSKREQSIVPSKVYDIHEKLPIPHWKTFINNKSNKASLLNFLAESWMKDHAKIPQGITLFLGGMLLDAGRTVAVTSYNVEDVPELSCRIHEEADTRAFCHLYYVAETLDCQRAVLQPTDTDIVVMALYYTVRVPGLQEMWIHKMNTFLPCHQIVQEIGNIVNNGDVLLATSVLLSIHILTGCDTVSYIYRKGKKWAVEIAFQCMDELKPLPDYGTSDILSPIGEDIFNAARLFFIRLYTTHDFNGNLNALRAHLFGSTKSDLRNLPPTENAFHFHVLRALNQMVVSKRAHQSVPVLPDPLKYGRQVQDGILRAIMMNMYPKPNIARQSKYCGCSKSHCLRGCSCARANVKCEIACRCAADPVTCSRVQDDSDIENIIMNE